MEKDDLKRGPDQHSCVDDDNPFEMGLGNPNSALAQHPLLMLARDSQFNEAEHAYSREECEV